MTTPSIGDGNNVFGEIAAPKGLRSVLNALTPLVGQKKASIYTSQYKGEETLRIETTLVEFDSTPLEATGYHLFNGRVADSPEDAVAFVRTMSRLLTEAGIANRFEVYADGELVGCV